MADRPMDAYIAQALAALGSDDTEFILTAKMPGVVPGTAVPQIALDCRVTGCGWGFSVGQMELWEFVADAREHWESEHAATGDPS
jgi:hypothetical protein